MTLHLGYMRIMNFNVCLFFMRCSSSSYSNLCVGFHVNLFNVCEKIARPHTRTRSGTHAHIKCGTPTHLRMVQNARLLAHIFFSVCCYEKSGVLHNIMHSFFIGLSSFFLYFFWQMLKMAERNLEKINKLFCELSF